MKTEREFASWDEIGKPIFEQKRIYFADEESAIYLKRKTWGITGNHQITIISTNPELEFKADSISDYIFKGFAEVIYKAENKTLKIYSHHKPDIPSYFNSKIEIELIKFKNNAEWRKLEKQAEKNYQVFE
jgi:hypothetical protein